MSDENSNRLTYRDAGVDIDAGNLLVERIKPAAASTRRPGTDSALGGFGGLFDLKATGYKDPVLVAATDGVGTKLKIAIAANRHQTIGIDLVAMCVNDLVVQGAEPLFFLDYFATGKLAVEAAAQVIEGIAQGCLGSGCALIGGETAEMPGMYAAGHYDLAGFAVGAVERGDILPRMDGIADGDILLGLASSGPHSNGYSLIRRVVEVQGLSYDQPAPFDPEKTLGEALLTPTRLYVKSCLPLAKQHVIKAMAHITGGGFLDNIPRVLPDWLKAEVNAAAWPLPPVFRWLAKAGGVTAHEMARTFNCGIGMVLVVSHCQKDDAIKQLTEAGETIYEIGRLRRREPGEEPCAMVNLEQSGW